MRTLTVLVSGEEQTLCETMRAMLAGQPDIQTCIQVCRAGAVDVPGQPTPQHDVGVVLLGANPEATLRALTGLAAISRAGVIVVGRDGDAGLMRQAMRAGARDFFGPPVARADLLEAVRGIARETEDAPAQSAGSVAVVIDARGGAGASFVALNLAHCLALRDRQPVALVDLDLQSGSLPLGLDLEPSHSLLDALHSFAQLDGLALQGYVARHASGVHVMSAVSEQMPLDSEIPAEAVSRLLDVVGRNYGRAVVHLPCRLDRLAGAAMAAADRVLVVMQQSVVGVRDAKRMLRTVGKSFGVARDRQMLVVNRYEKHNLIGSKEIDATIAPAAMHLLPNDFRTVSQSLDRGVPLLDYARNAAVTQAMQQLADRLGQAGAETAQLERRGFRAAIAHSFGVS